MRERQKVKDNQMSIDCHSSLVVWDGRSKGCFANIRRSLELQKPVSIYLASENIFIQNTNINEAYIENVYRTSVGYSASEALEQLKKRSFDGFPSTRGFNKFLLENDVLQKENGVYFPNEKYRKYFKTNIHRGKKTGVNFKIDFFDWFEGAFPNSKKPETVELEFE